MQSISKNQQKLIKSLKYKKYRHKNGLFVVEGVKSIKEFIRSSYQIESLYSIADIFSIEKQHMVLISPEELKSISFLTTSQVALGVFKIKKNKPLKLKSLTLALDGIKDPGNLGTIIRLCDWFGVKKIICSNDTVDCYNPKVVQASMGSLTRVQLYYENIEQIMDKYTGSVYTTDMDGDNIYTSTIDQNAIIVMGNESNGVSEPLRKKINDRISIPQFGKNNTTESLNVAMATSIILSEIKRRTIETLS